MMDPQTSQTNSTPRPSWLWRQWQSVRWRMAYAVALVVLAVMLGANLLLLQRVQGIIRAAFEQAMVGRAEAATTDLIDRSLWLAGPDALTPELTRLAQLMDVRITALRSNGIPFADSSTATALPETITQSPEVQTALTGHTATGTRPDESGTTQRLYVAVPVRAGGVVLGALQFSSRVMPWNNSRSPSVAGCSC